MRGPKCRGLCRVLRELSITVVRKRRGRDGEEPGKEVRQSRRKGCSTWRCQSFLPVAVERSERAMAGKTTGLGDFERASVAFESSASGQDRGGHQVASTGAGGERMPRKQAETCCFLSSGNEGDVK